MRYSHYKPTGIPWLPEVPEGWEMRPFKSVYGFGKGLSITKENLVSEGVPVVSYGQIHSKDNDGMTLSDSLLRFVDKSYIETNPQCLLQTGDMAIADTSEDLEGCGNAVVMDRSERVFAGYHTIIGRIKESANAAFLAYEFCCNAWRSQIRLAVHGVKLYSITKQILSGTRFVLPPLSTQRAIVAFLDEKCGKVDRLVVAKEKEVALLKELKQSMIAEAVTRGVRENRRLVSFGIPWLPEVPEGWEMVRNKTFLTITDEKVGERKNEFTLLSLTKQGVIVRDLTEMKGKFPKDYDTYLVVRPGNLVFCLFDVDETPRTVGLVRNVGMLTGAYTNFQVDACRVLPEYACYYYLQVDDTKKLRPYYTGLRKVVKTNTFLQLRFPCPPLAEQRAIVAHIEARAAKIDAAVAGLEKEIAALKEYKQRLIADVVTGQRRVA